MAWASGSIPARVTVVESLGRETLLYADAGDLRAVDGDVQESLFAVHRSSQIVAAIGDPITLGIPRDAIFLFDSAGQTIRFPAGSAMTSKH